MRSRFTSGFNQLGDQDQRKKRQPRRNATGKKKARIAFRVMAPKAKEVPAMKMIGGNPRITVGRR